MFPLISACVLPVLIHTENWTYPVAVFFMSAIVASGRVWMEKIGWRPKTSREPLKTPLKKVGARWIALILAALPVMSLAVLTSNQHFILPPLIVVYVELANSAAGFRNKPLEIYFLLIVAAVVGSVFQEFGYYRLRLPETLVAFLIMVVIFTIFEIKGKCYPPVGAVSLIPLLLPKESLPWIPLRVAVGAALLIAISLLFFQRCYKWSKPQLIHCFVPRFIIKKLIKRKIVKKLIHKF
jgi:hypothetical protein